jgi:hypothetical protein
MLLQVCRGEVVVRGAFWEVDTLILILRASALTYSKLELLWFCVLAPQRPGAAHFYGVCVSHTGGQECFVYIKFHEELIFRRNSSDNEILS